MTMQKRDQKNKALLSCKKIFEYYTKIELTRLIILILQPK